MGLPKLGPAVVGLRATMVAELEAVAAVAAARITCSLPPLAVRSLRGALTARCTSWARRCRRIPLTCGTGITELPALLHAAAWWQQRTRTARCAYCTWAARSGETCVCVVHYLCLFLFFY